jgi:hypothetical protein
MNALKDTPESTMKYPIAFTAMALVLAATAGAPVLAADEGKPTPPVMSDVAPLPPQDRSSLGAVIFADAPVIAQREAYMMAAARYEHLLSPEARRMTAQRMQGVMDPTRMMGGSPAPAQQK